nr:hypothetical protein B0A51_15134 [Rachicladosporium sp. CCFEE 5018]
MSPSSTPAAVTAVVQSSTSYGSIFGVVQVHLPLETRLVIFELAVPRESLIAITPRGFGIPSVLLLDRRSRAETRAIFYQVNIFTITVHGFDSTVLVRASRWIRAMNAGTPAVQMPRMHVQTVYELDLDNLLTWVRQYHAGLTLWAPSNLLIMPLSTRNAFQLAIDVLFRSAAAQRGSTWAVTLSRLRQFGAFGRLDLLDTLYHPRDPSPAALLLPSDAWGVTGPADQNEASGEAPSDESSKSTSERGAQGNHDDDEGST